MARSPSQKEIAAFIIGHGITDFVTGGRLSLIERNALWKVLKKLGPPAVSTTGRLAGTAAMGAMRAAPAIARGARFVTMRHPYIAAAVVIYETVKHREQIAQLAQEGWEIIEATGGAMAPIIQERIETRGLIQPLTRLPGLKRRKSAYNRAVSAGMKALKRSNKMGKKGKFSNSKRAFALVSKTASKLRKGSKVALGHTPIGIAAKAMKNILRRKKK